METDRTTAVTTHPDPSRIIAQDFLALPCLRACGGGREAIVLGEKLCDTCSPILGQNLVLSITAEISPNVHLRGTREGEAGAGAGGGGFQRMC